MQLRHYVIKHGYDESILNSFIDDWHEFHLRTSCFKPFDFTLSMQWGEAAEKAGFATTRRYVLYCDGNPTGLFQGLAGKRLFYKSLLAGSTSGNGIVVNPDSSSRVMHLFLSKIIQKENFSTLQIFAPVSLNILAFSEKPNYTLYVYLDRSWEELQQKMDRKQRNRVRKAVKEGVTVEFSSSTVDLKKAYAVISASLAAKPFLIPPWNYSLKLHECFAEHGCDSVVALGYFNNTSLSAAHLIGFDRKLVLWKAGSLEKGLKLNVSSLIQAKVIEWARNHGYLIYDMGGTNPHDPAYAGIHRFKSSFGGSPIANVLIEKRAFYVPLLKKTYNFFKDTVSRLL